MSPAPSLAPADGASSLDALVVVSNRLATPQSTQTGGLATALQAALSDAGGTWIGWNGSIAADATLSDQVVGNVRYLGLPLDRELHDRYYLGYCNRVLWPLLHSRVDLVAFDEREHEAYDRANERFADVVAAHCSPRSVLWIHDYHLVPLAAKLRARGLRNRIGFFLHTPFPPADIARVLPRHEQVLGALRHYDLVGVQTPQDEIHLRDFLDSGSGKHAMPVIRAVPIGVEPDAVASAATAAMATPAVRNLRKSLEGRKLVIAVDRLDYSKGLPQRFASYNRLLERHPDLLRQVSYLQVAPISRGEVREYRQLKRDLDELAGRINARHGDASWVPLRYVAKSHPHELVSGFLRSGAVGLVTPLRDGMNLVAKEYVASQDPADPGVLVLSQFAGAARQLEDALLVNPHDVGATADALALALRMPLAERRRRWERLMSGLHEFPLSRWRREFLEALAAVPDRAAAAGPISNAA